MVWRRGSHLPDVHIPDLVGTPASSKEASPRGVFSHSSSESMVPETQAAGCIILWIWAMMSYRIKLHTEAWELNKNLPDVLVTFHSSLPLCCTGEHQVGHQCSFTSPAWRTCENHLPQPAGCTLSNAIQTQPHSISLSLFLPSLQSLVALELSQEFLSKLEALPFI